MNNKIREYENRYWLLNDDIYELHFVHFYDDEIILKFVQDKDDSENYIYVSDLLNVEHGEEQADTVQDAMDNISYEDRDELQKFLDAWCSKQTGTKTAYPCYNEYVRVSKEWFG